MARSVYNRRDHQRTATRQVSRYEYIDGSTARQSAYSVRPLPDRYPVRPQQRPVQPQQKRRKSTSTATRRNRMRALQMNLGYVTFLTAASIATLFVCVNFLQLQAQNITFRNQVASAESRLNELKLENDATYENALSTVDLQSIRSIAINKLGMVYADEGQVKTYRSSNNDYVRQYEDVPVE